MCMTGPGSEGGAKTCYVKFGMVQGRREPMPRFDRLLDSIEGFAALPRGDFLGQTDLTL